MSSFKAAGDVQVIARTISRQPVRYKLSPTMLMSLERSKPLTYGKGHCKGEYGEYRFLSPTLSFLTVFDRCSLDELDGSFPMLRPLSKRESLRLCCFSKCIEQLQPLSVNRAKQELISACAPSFSRFGVNCTNYSHNTLTCVTRAHGLVKCNTMITSPF